MPSSLKALLLTLNADNGSLVEELKREARRVTTEDFPLAGDNANQKEILAKRMNDLRVAATMMVPDSAAKFVEASKALLERNDEDSAYQAYLAALDLHMQARSVLAHPQASQPVPDSPKEPAQAPIAVPTPPAPKADEPKGDKKVAGTPPAPVPAPEPPKAKGEDKEPKKPDVLAAIKTAFDENFARLGGQITETGRRVDSLETRTGDLETTLEGLATVAEPYTRVITTYTPEQFSAVMDYVLGELDTPKRDKFLMELPDLRRILRRRTSNAGPTAK